MQEFIQKQCMDKNKQWIYQVIDNTFKSETETVLLHNTEWVLCIDKHPGPDIRYLVVFKDKSIKTIRDLRQSHIPVLQHVHREVTTFLQQAHGVQESAMYKLYFHYVPSVFQLHLHVSCKQVHHNNLRVKYLRDVVRNLQADSLWYANALIYTNKNRLYKQYQQSLTDRHAVSRHPGRKTTHKAQSSAR